MKKSRILILATVLILFSIIVFVVDHIVAVSNMLSNINPLLGTISLWFLLGLMSLCIFYLVGIYYLRQKPLICPINPRPEHEQLYITSLIKRLNSNKQLVNRGVRVQHADDAASAITLLDGLVDDEIKRVARRAFVSTSIAQNGRLDSIIVFYQIALLIWKISKIYDQRPYPYELWKIYCNVLSTSLISYGIEQVDLTDQVGSIISPLFANSILNHVPVVKTFTKVFTHAILTGSANAGLVCRVGIVARNYMGLKTRVDYRVQLRPTVEATRMLNSISSESVQKVLAALGGSIKDITAQGTKKATGTIVNAAGVAVQGVADAGRVVGESTIEVFGTTRKGLKKASACAVRGVQTLGSSVRGITAQGTKKATDTIINAAGVAVQGVADAGGAVGGRTHEAFCATRRGAKKIAASAVRTTQLGLWGIRKSARKAGSIFSGKSS